ncbi:hypothetical protein BLS_005933 [Venturia inaequalis]|uniref:Uncharacterized protein n=1 Tax=Venturia inaequalis TaxID=5025 RepID=A0A8H3V3M6_VENIN|nr:hypothetical protein BLS_005933 [Venturia inaequalis]KAE9990087.1 hypothetical protein EG327_001899 [Venturia inaequalis]
MANRHYGHGQYGHEQQPSYDNQAYGHPPAQQYQQPAYSTPAHPTHQQPPAHAAPIASGPNYRWWIPSAGIRRDVIVADIQRYLGQDALVKPGNCPRAISVENEGQPGYLISAYRNLTSEMVQDLRTDSANFERSGARGNYQESQVHQSRQYWGPTGAETQAAAAPPQPAAPAYAPSAQQRYPPQASAAAPSQHYATTSAAYDSYPAQTAYHHNSAPSAFSASPAGSDASRNYTYGSSTASSAPAYQQPAGRPADPRQADPTPRYAPTSQQYAQPTASSTHHTTAAQSSGGVPPGYYLASDGRYYPVSAQR